MKSFFNRFRLCLLYCCFACLLPLAAHAKPTGEIIFSPSADFFGLWIGNVQDRQDARSVFRQKLLIIELSIQKDDRYLVAVAERFVEDDLHLVIDAYLLNRKNWFTKEKNLTRGLFGEVLDAAISEKGDIVFTNRSFRVQGAVPRQASGIHLIPNSEIRKPIPQAKLLKEVEAHYIDWAPNGKEIAFDTADGIFLMDRLTLKISHIIKDGYRPVFSPDGKRLAFLTRTKPTRLSILSLTIPQNLKHIADVSPLYFTWSPDGRYIVYTLAAPNLTRKNYAVPVAGGPPERILEMYDRGVRLFEWTHGAKSGAHAVEPTNKLTTLWGKLKQQN